MGGGFCVIQKDGRMVACDRGFMGFLGETDGAAVLGKLLSEIPPGSAQALLAEAHRQVSRSEGCSTFRLGGMEGVVAPLFREDGETLYLVTVFPEKAPGPWRLFTPPATPLLFIQDPLGRIVAVSDASFRLVEGQSGFDFCEDFTAYLSPVEIPRARRALAQLMMGQPVIGEHYILRNLNSGSPQPAWVTAIPVYGKGKAFFGVVGSVTLSPPEREDSLTLEEILTTLRFLERRVKNLATLRKRTPPKSPSLSLERLTPRQIEILRALALGYSTKKIARSLSLSTSTVETHRRLIMRKLNLSSFAHLVRAAVFLGVVPENPWEESRNP